MDHAVFDLWKFRLDGVVHLVGDAVGLVQTQGRVRGNLNVHINPRPEHAGADIVDAQNRFRLKMQITRLATGSNTAIPILAPAIPTRAPTEERASER